MDAVIWLFNSSHLWTNKGNNFRSAGFVVGSAYIRCVLSLVAPCCLTGCPIDPFLPPWCLPGCPSGSFLPPWCLAGYPAHPFLPPWCFASCPMSPLLPPWRLAHKGPLSIRAWKSLTLADYWSHLVLPSHREARKAQKRKKHKGAREELNPGPFGDQGSQSQRLSH